MYRLISARRFCVISAQIERGSVLSEADSVIRSENGERKQKEIRKHRNRLPENVIPETLFMRTLAFSSLYIG